MILAGLDLGTLTCRLLIAMLDPDGRMVELHGDRRILCLGEGVDRDHLLRPEAIARVVAALRDWRKVVDRFHPAGEVAVATSAVREARNRDEFLALVKRETGFVVNVISGEEEARLTMLGIRSGLPPGVTDILGLDIGGGSTEFILDRRGDRMDGGIPTVCSFELGVVRLTERALRQDPPDESERRLAMESVGGMIEHVRARLGDVRKTTFVGTAGTITTLAAMAQKLPTYEKARIQNYRLGLDMVRALEHTLLRLPKAQRRELPGLEPGREGVIVAGTLILRGVMEAFDFHECLVSDLGLREGLLIDLAARLK